MNNDPKPLKFASDPELAEAASDWEPKDADCFGHYLYGSGYYADEDDTHARVTRAQASSFCHECPKLQECEDAHERHVRELFPDDAERFDKLAAQAIRRGVPPTLLAVNLAKQGKPDPYLRTAIENFNLGRSTRMRKEPRRAA